MGTTFNARAAWLDLRAALEVYEAQLDGYALGEATVEYKLSKAVVGAIIPQLKGMLTVIDATSGEWTTPRNKINEKIAGAFAAGQPLAGYDPKDWLAWGIMLQRLNAFLDTEYTIDYPDDSTETITPRQMINTIFTKVAVA